MGADDPQQVVSRWKKLFLGGGELAFFALALLFFIPAPRSVPSPYSHEPAVFIVAAAITVSRLFAYRSGRSAIVCILECLIVVTMFFGHVIGLNIAAGNGVAIWWP